MKISKANRRDKKRTKKNKMVVENKGIFLLEQEKEKRDKKLRRLRKQKIKERESQP